jgi:hypothetical protein
LNIAEADFDKTVPIQVEQRTSVLLISAHNDTVVALFAMLGHCVRIEGEKSAA